MKIKDYFSTKKEVIAVYIFGSFNKENYSINNSDIDLGIMLESEADRVSAFDFKLKAINELEEILNCEIDIIIFSQTNLRMQHQILKGKLIVGKSNKERVRREQKAFRKYLDMKYFFEVYEKNLGKEFDNG